MKKLLDKTGLRLMMLGILATIIYFFVASYIYSSVPQFHFPTFCVIVLPAVFVTGMTLLDRLFGGLLGALFSVIALTFCIYVSVVHVDTQADFGYFAITICFLLGTACILASLGIHAPHNTKAKA
jgi:hypothetical protein